MPPAHAARDGGEAVTQAGCGIDRVFSTFNGAAPGFAAGPRDDAPEGDG